jgi:hypothetical protein
MTGFEEGNMYGPPDAVEAINRAHAVLLDFCQFSLHSIP